MFARVKNNNSDKKREANITLEVNGQQKAIASEEIAKESIVELNFNVAWCSLRKLFECPSRI
ncbi:hypothetical protein N9Y26_00245 [bacterium]|nr:hypothetical protein [bacterium]